MECGEVGLADHAIPEIFPQSDSLDHSSPLPIPRRIIHGDVGVRIVCV